MTVRRVALPSDSINRFQPGGRRYHRHVDEEQYVETMRHVDSRHGLPDDARQLGLDRNTEEGALIAMAGGLRPVRPAHRLVAWVLLGAFVLPLLLGVVHRIF